MQIKRGNSRISWLIDKDQGEATTALYVLKKAGGASLIYLLDAKKFSGKLIR